MSPDTRGNTLLCAHPLGCVLMIDLRPGGQWKQAATFPFKYFTHGNMENVFAQYMHIHTNGVHGCI